MNLLKIASLLITLVFSTTISAALVERLDGLAYYDTEANLTWLADANYAMTSGYDNDGRMDFDKANAWAVGLRVGGIDGWRLPSTVDVDNDGGTYTSIFQGVDYGYNITAHSEMSNMYYNVLGNSATYDTDGTYQAGTFNTGPFINLISYYYWSSTEYAGNDDGGAWSFIMGNNGSQSDFYKLDDHNAWAVHSGDVAVIATPIPAAAWLFSSGLVGLIGVARCKKS